MNHDTKPSLIILAGGKGTRLREVTGPDIPKPMVDIHGKPFLVRLVEHYISQGYGDITVSVNYKAEMIENYEWPTKTCPRFDRDLPDETLSDLYLDFIGSWVVNGDTWINDPLPEVTGPTVLTHNDVDAGAQFVGYGKIKVHKVSKFYDIGTPYGLDVFRQYFLTHLDKN